MFLISREVPVRLCTAVRLEKRGVVDPLQANMWLLIPKDEP